MQAQQNELPIETFRNEIVQTIEQHPITIIKARPGAGKSTRVPHYLLEAGYNVSVTQPTRLAAEEIAARVAENIGEKLGGTVGFRTAERKAVSDKTRCMFRTDPIPLIRELQRQRQHRDKRVVILDEVHEWKENLEILLAWVREEIQGGAEFKVVLMSATLDASELSSFCMDAPVIDVPGQLFPITTRKPGRSIAADVDTLVKEGRNVLVFLPGKREIDELLEELGTGVVNAELLPLHGQLSREDRQKCLRTYDRPKVVVATNIAQTSITIADIDAVVDCGYEKRIQVINGVEGLHTLPISQADSDQRKGRSGRTKPGIYIDHYPLYEFGEEGRPAFATPEIRCVRLDQLMLRLRETGFLLEAMELFHQPDFDDVTIALNSLKALRCLDEEGEITDLGRRIARLPVSANNGRMILEAAERGVLDDVIVIAAILEVKGLVDRKKDWAWRPICRGERDSDLLAQLAVFRAAEKMENHDERWNKGVFPEDFLRVCKVIKAVRRSLPSELTDDLTSSGDREDILKSVCVGMVDHLFRQTGYGSELQNGGEPRKLDFNSVVQMDHGNWVVGVPFDLEGENNHGHYHHRLVNMASIVELDWLLELAPHLVVRETDPTPTYKEELDVVGFRQSIKFNGNTISESFVEAPNHEQAPLVFAVYLALQSLDNGVLSRISEVNNNGRAIREAEDYNRRAGKTVFDFVETEVLAAWFLERLDGACCLADVADRSVLEIPELDSAKIREIERDYPEEVTIPGLGRMFVDYQEDQPPVVKVGGWRANWQDIPDQGFELPGGRRVAFLVEHADFGVGNFGPTEDVPGLKRQVADYENDRAYRQFLDRPPQFRVPATLRDPDARIPGIRRGKYAKDALTGEDLPVFAVFAFEHGLYRTRFTRDRSEADVWQAEFSAHVEELRRRSPAKAPEPAGGLAAELKRQQALDAGENPDAADSSLEDDSAAETPEVSAPAELSEDALAGMFGGTANVRKKK